MFFRERTNRSLGTLRSLLLFERRCPSRAEAARQFQELQALKDSNVKHGAQQAAALSSEIGRLSDNLTAAQKEKEMVERTLFQEKETLAELLQQKVRRNSSKHVPLFKRHQSLILHVETRIVSFCNGLIMSNFRIVQTNLEKTAMELSAKAEEDKFRFDQELQAKAADIDRLNSLVSDEMANKVACLTELTALKEEFAKKMEEEESLQSALGQLQSANAQVSCCHGKVQMILLLVLKCQEVCIAIVGLEKRRLCSPRSGLANPLCNDFSDFFGLLCS
jgi:hypothetical protein